MTEHTSAFPVIHRWFCRSRAAVARSDIAATRVALLLAVATWAALLVACGGDSEAGEPRAETAPAPPLEQTTDAAADGGQAPDPDFVNDQELAELVSAEALLLPARFAEAPRDDLEPILSLGLVAAAARVSFASVTTGELLLADVLQLEADADPLTFFEAFADALGDNPEFRGVHQIGVPRGVGDRARQYAFTVQGDEAETAAVLRGSRVMLLTYRYPEGLRAPINVGALLRRADAILSS